jgi:hypothetical protein
MVFFEKSAMLTKIDFLPKNETLRRSLVFFLNDFFFIFQKPIEILSKCEKSMDQKRIFFKLSLKKRILR